jgi:sulfate permease, SulP family
MSFAFAKEALARSVRSWSADDGFAPKLISTLREGYSASALRADLMAGLTVAVVALPLSMAIAIASGATPERGLYTAIIGGFVISALGGSRYQIGGPAGAFIVLVAATISRHGIEGMLLAAFLAGAILVLAGLLRLGGLVRLIPHAVTVGFTAGIGMIILASQIKDLLGIHLGTREPVEFLPKLETLAGHIASAAPAAILLSVLTIALILSIRRIRPQWPALLIGIAVASLGAFEFGLGVETIGSRFGGIPAALPLPAFPDLSGSRILAVLPDALAFAFLGAIESLLSAVVADRMGNRKHRSNTELVAQGIANMASAVFGGLPATGTIARTATNVRAGAKSPVAGMLHSLFVMAFMLLAAPLLSFIPMAALAGVLAVVAWNMLELKEIAALIRSDKAAALACLATLLVTVLRDLLEGIALGLLIYTLARIWKRRRPVSR